MKKKMSMLLALVMVFSLCCPAYAASDTAKDNTLISTVQDVVTREHGDSNMLDDLRCTDSDNKRLVLVIKEKEKILQELDTLSINRATLFPEIDDVAEYLKGKYGEEK